METKYWLGLLIIASVVVGTITYNVVETGEEIVCRTNSPIGWEIVEDYGEYYKVVCPYKTKEPIEAYCSSFRSTGSYERYGCNEVILVEEESKQLVETEWGTSYNCYPEGCEV